MAVFSNFKLCDSLWRFFQISNFKFFKILCRFNFQISFFHTVLFPTVIFWIVSNFFSIKGLFSLHSHSKIYLSVSSWILAQWETIREYPINRWYLFDDEFHQCGVCYMTLTVGCGPTQLAVLGIAERFTPLPYVTWHHMVGQKNDWSKNF